MTTVDVAEYCRALETYLCQKNDGHLIRIVGPSFDLVSEWATTGVPFKVACRGVDRYFERYYRRGPRRRPVRIDFCEADVQDAFDEWRRAIGLTADSGQTPVDEHGAGAPRRSGSLPAHLERVILRLTDARVAGLLDASFDGLIDRVARELDIARSEAKSLRGERRQALIARLSALDKELLQAAQRSIDATAGARLSQDAHDELAAYRGRMEREAYERAHAASLDRLLRDRFKLPVVTF